jgi:DNA-binding transcriptional ArsR family regulator
MLSKPSQIRTGVISWRSCGASHGQSTSLAEGLPISRPAVSQHLKALLDSKLVTVTNQGTRRIYTVRTEGFHAPQPLGRPVLVLTWSGTGLGTSGKAGCCDWRT